MSQSKREADREERISMEVVVDAYGPEEQAMGWYYYLEENLQFPFTAICISKRRISPLRLDAVVDVLRIAPASECEREMFVEIAWDDEALAVPLMQLAAPDADDDTQQAIADWHYWVSRGYEFG
jgi:hypothetical protein